MNTHIDTLNNVRATMAAAGIGADTQVHGQLRAAHANNLVVTLNAAQSGPWSRLGSTFLMDSLGQLGGDPSTFIASPNAGRARVRWPARPGRRATAPGAP
ncbi:hypothetical protein [Burkholderia vietnamiensis]|uniref:hypothetical protein n=1 Tax=Burkholderia vietnamiensis TaxID=60552 RepID=UPI001CF52169|nr:hypothetical protein [Burkholderia vietnamiensis]MCA8180636.1 hypothetical protein [Burkholderia vietnamiensis]